jgi:hypothetical protein
MRIDPHLIEEALTAIATDLCRAEGSEQAGRIARHAKVILINALQAMDVSEKDIAFLSAQIDFNIDWSPRTTSHSLSFD